MNAQPVSFTSPYAADEAEILRRQRMAELLQAQAQQPLGGTEMAGQIAIRRSPLEGLAQMAKAGSANAQMRDVEARRRALSEQMRSDTTSDMTALVGAMRGTPASVQTDAADNVTQTPAIAAGQIDPSVLGQIRRPDIQQMAMQQIIAQLQPQKPVVVGRSLLDPISGKVVGKDATWQAEQDAARKAKEAELQARLEDARTSREERAAAQRELAQMQMDLRREIAGQTAALRRDAIAQGNKPPAGFRYKPNGDLERIPGGPADIKAEAELQKKASGAGDVDVALSTLRDAYDRLEKGGGITSTKNEGLGNVLPSLSASSGGQAVGKLFGTQNQSARNDIAMARPALLAALMKATGMSAKQMDSNAELKLWLSTATDPTLDVESNRRALNNIEKKYITGAQGSAAPTRNPQDAAALEWANANPNDPRAAAIKKKLGM